MSIVRKRDWNDFVKLDSLSNEDIILETLKQREKKRNYANRRQRLG
jgi:hypothetical protein